MSQKLQSKADRVLIQQDWQNLFKESNVHCSTQSPDYSLLLCPMWKIQPKVLLIYFLLLSISMNMPSHMGTLIKMMLAKQSLLPLHVLLTHRWRRFLVETQLRVEIWSPEEKSKPALFFCETPKISSQPLHWWGRTMGCPQLCPYKAFNGLIINCLVVKG